MFITLNNDKIIFGSLMTSLSNRIVLGENVKTESLSLFTLINKSLQYAIGQYNNGNQNYFSKIEYLKELLVTLKNKCPDICNYRERVIPRNVCTIATPII